MPIPIQLSSVNIQVNEISSGCLKKAESVKKHTIIAVIPSIRQLAGIHILFLHAETLHFTKRIVTLPAVTAKIHAAAT